MQNLSHKACDVTVIIPFYNRGHHIRDAIESVLNQTAPPREIIIVDDGSTDGGSDIASTVVRSCDRIIRFTTNQGGGAARNAGINAATSSLVAFLDSDDRWDSEKLAFQLRQTATLPADGRWLAYTNTLNLTEAGEHLANRYLLSEHQHVSEYLLVDFQVIQTSTWLMPTSFAREVLFDEALRKHQDWDFVIRAGHVGAKFIGTMSPYVHYDDASVARISSQVIPLQTKIWLAKVSEIITPRAEASVSVALLFPSALHSSPHVALGYLRRAVRLGVPYSRIFGSIVISILPISLAGSLRKISRRIRR